jgi:hypothetical protein
MTRLAVLLKDRFDVLVEADRWNVSRQRHASPNAAYEYCRSKDPGNHLAASL